MKFLVIITSTIFYTQKPLSYCDIRSVFTPEERIQQTLQTIQSIQEKIPNATIVLLETGTISVEVIKEKVDQYVFLGDKKIIRYVCDSPWKGLGEIVGILSYRKKMKQQDYDVCVKISGRYYLDNYFTLKSLSSEKFSFLRSSDGESYSTRLYSFPKKIEKYYIQLLIRSIPWFLCKSGIEHIFKRIIPKEKVTLLDQIGVSGYVAPTGEFIQE